MSTKAYIPWCSCSISFEGDTFHIERCKLVYVFILWDVVTSIKLYLLANALTLWKWILELLAQWDGKKWSWHANFVEYLFLYDLMIKIKMFYIPEIDKLQNKYITRMEEAELLLCLQWTFSCFSSLTWYKDFFQLFLIFKCSIRHAVLLQSCKAWNPSNYFLVWSE